MHEMSYVIKIVNQVQETAEAERKRRGGNVTSCAGKGKAACGNTACAGFEVRKVTVEVGEMTDILPEYLSRYYSEAVAGTSLEHSELEVRMIPVKVLCRGCGEIYHPDRKHHYSCPLCGCSAGEILSGRGLRMRDVTLEDV